MHHIGLLQRIASLPAIRYQVVTIAWSAEELTQSADQRASDQADTTSALRRAPITPTRQANVYGNTWALQPE